MVTLHTAPRQRSVEDISDLPITIPNPAQVQAVAAEIRKSWSPAERRRRARLARRLLQSQRLFADPPSAIAGYRLRPRFPPSR